NIVRRPGGAQVLLVDPSGNLVELFEPPPESDGQPHDVERSLAATAAPSRFCWTVSQAIRSSSGGFYFSALVSLSYAWTKSWFCCDLWHAKQAVSLACPLGVRSALKARYSHSPLRRVSGYSAPHPLP